MLSPEQISWTEKFVGFRLSDSEVPAGSGMSDGEDPSAGGIIDSIKGLFKSKPQRPVPRADLGKPQQDRASELMEAMPDDDRAKVQKLLSQAKGDEKKYLTKAVASKHSAAELEVFYKEIAGKDQKWMDENLHLIGLSSGKGIKQQWHDSCGPTTVQAMMGELDPVYALKLHKENKDVTKSNEADGEAMDPKMAEEQRAMLEDRGGGVAVSRDQHEGTGKGMNITNLLGDQTPKIGLKFSLEGTETDEKMTKGLNDAAIALKKGLPVPVRVGGAAGGHAVLMTGIDDGPPRRISFHDPWDGKTLVFTEEQIKTNKINIAGWTKMTHVWAPSEDEPTPAAPPPPAPSGGV